MDDWVHITLTFKKDRQKDWSISNYAPIILSFEKNKQKDWYASDGAY